MNTIAVIEDDLAVRIVLVRMFARQGYNAFGFASVEEFRRGSAQVCPDVVLCDVVMPGEEDGLDLVRNCPCEDCVHILMSGYPEEEFLKGRDLPQGMLFLQKPFTPTDVIELLARDGA